MGLLDDQTQQAYYQGSSFGGYQFVSLDEVINNFIIAYVGEGRIIPKTPRSLVQFHAMRAIQELSYDTFKSTKSQEIELPPSLTIMLPQDYVNYVSLTFLGAKDGLERKIYPTRKTSNPLDAVVITCPGNKENPFNSKCPNTIFDFVFFSASTVSC